MRTTKATGGQAQLFEPARISHRGFTLVKLLLVIGIIALLLALLLPALGRVRAMGRSANCASQLREFGRAMQFYAEDNRGWVPRDHTPWLEERNPYWMIQLGPYLEARDDWTAARSDPKFAEQLAADFDQFHCAEHPLAGTVPGTYVINAYKFETDPKWDPDGPVRLSRVRNTSGVVWITEASDDFGGDPPAAEYHDLFTPEHLPGGRSERVSDVRHYGGMNALFFDTSVRRIRSGNLTLQMFDDGIRDRKNENVLSGG